MKDPNPFKKFYKKKSQPDEKPDSSRKRDFTSNKKRRPKRNTHQASQKREFQAPFPLNKYLAHSGVCSRRKAVEHIKAGAVKVNNKTILEPGFKVNHGDKVVFNNKPLQLQQQLEYLLLNKPKDCLTTTKDPRGRRTVMDLVRHATKERVYPVGRLDRNTSGLLLITNDGTLAQKLSHPSGQIEKVYHVTLDKPLTKNDFKQLLEGVKLEEGIMAADALAFVDAQDNTQVGLEIHSGRNRVVRRLFETLGYEVKQLDRVLYAGLTKKNLPRGKWRKLTEKEIRVLKHFTSQKTAKAKRKS